jgi:hypothetical protein
MMAEDGYAFRAIVQITKTGAQARYQLLDATGFPSWTSDIEPFGTVDEARAYIMRNAAVRGFKKIRLRIC